MKTKVAFIAHPPDIRYIRNFYGTIARNWPLIRLYTKNLKDWM